MSRTIVRIVVAALLAVLPWTAIARVQDESASLCWNPDVEFPVPCDEDEE